MSKGNDMKNFKNLNLLLVIMLVFTYAEKPVFAEVAPPADPAATAPEAPGVEAPKPVQPVTPAASLPAPVANAQEWVMNNGGVVPEAEPVPPDAPVSAADRPAPQAAAPPPVQTIIAPPVPPPPPPSPWVEAALAAVDAIINPPPPVDPLTGLLNGLQDLVNIMGTQNQINETIGPLSDLPFVPDFHNCQFFTMAGTLLAQQNGLFVFQLGVLYYNLELLPPDFVGPPRPIYGGHSTNVVYIAPSATSPGQGLYAIYEPQTGSFEHFFTAYTDELGNPQIPASEILAWLTANHFGNGGQIALTADVWHMPGGYLVTSDPGLNQWAWQDFDPDYIRFLYQIYLPANMADQAIDLLDFWHERVRQARIESTQVPVR